MFKIWHEKEGENIRTICTIDHMPSGELFRKLFDDPNPALEGSYLCCSNTETDEQWMADEDDTGLHWDPV